MHIAPLFTEEHHPVVVTPRADANAQALRDYVMHDAESVQRLLLRHGAILFRGFGLSGPEDFKACVESLGAQPFGYVGGNSPRSRVAPSVYTSTEHPASEVISAHNEMSYLPTWPLRIFFFGALPSRVGGQTPLVHGRDVLTALPPEIVSTFRKKKVSYIRHFQPRMRLGKSWQETYSTQDRAEVEAIIAAQGSTCRWLPDGGLRVSTTCEALTEHPQTGAEVWFNQAEQWHPSALQPAARVLFEDMLGKSRLPHDCEFGDGDPIDEDALAEIRRTLDTHKLQFDWQRGDLLMIDNVLMMHGRESFEGERRVLAYLSST